MFFRLILTPMGIISSFSGFVLFFLLNIVGKKGIMLALWGGFLGALGLFAAWGVASYLFTVLFSTDEINRIFFHHLDKDILHKMPVQQATTEFTVSDEEDDLTMEDLYSASESPIQGDFELETGGFQQNINPKAETQSKIDASGRFNVESSTRSVRTNAKEAALAARKVLMNDKQ
ncbi:MAG: hypothetical protein ACRC9L_02160 [Brevinema sp.]